tara:strand:+ start:22 stop:285 length:264 start_codon:yes stop_codon:yes gene_type:complete
MIVMFLISLFINSGSYTLIYFFENFKKSKKISKLVKNKVYYVFFNFSLFNLLFSLRLNLGFFFKLESLKDFPLYLFDILKIIHFEFF